MDPQENSSTGSVSNSMILHDKNKKLFPQKLWELIHDQRYQHCLRWSLDGRRVYLNRAEFEAHYLKTPANQFHTQKAISFVRQMNMYGFRKVDDSYYENDNFKRHKKHLLHNMIRRHPNKGLFVGLVASAAAAAARLSSKQTNHQHSNSSNQLHQDLTTSHQQAHQHLQVAAAAAAAAALQRQHHTSSLQSHYDHRDARLGGLTSYLEAVQSLQQQQHQQQQAAAAAAATHFHTNKNQTQHQAAMVSSRQAALVNLAQHIQRNSTANSSSSVSSLNSQSSLSTLSQMSQEKQKYQEKFDEGSNKPQTDQKQQQQQSSIQHQSRKVRLLNEYTNDISNNKHCFEKATVDEDQSTMQSDNIDVEVVSDQNSFAHQDIVKSLMQLKNLQQSGINDLQQQAYAHQNLIESLVKLNPQLATSQKSLTGSVLNFHKSNSSEMRHYGSISPSDERFATPPSDSWSPPSSSSISNYQSNIDSFNSASSNNSALNLAKCASISAKSSEHSDQDLDVSEQESCERSLNDEKKHLPKRADENSMETDVDSCKIDNLNRGNDSPDSAHLSQTSRESSDAQMLNDDSDITLNKRQDLSLRFLDKVCSREAVSISNNNLARIAELLDKYVNLLIKNLSKFERNSGKVCLDDEALQESFKSTSFEMFQV